MIESTEQINQVRCHAPATPGTYNVAKDATAREVLICQRHRLLLTVLQADGTLQFDTPPPITHPEHFYGFIGVTVAWQLMFLVISRDPVRYRAAMFPAIVEKVTFVVAVALLYAKGRVAMPIVFFSAVDFVLGILFTISLRRTPKT